MTRSPNLSPLKSTLEKATLVGADIKFDLKYFRNLGIRPRKVFDVVISGRVLSNMRRFGNSLDDLAERYLGFPLEKELQKSWIRRPEEVLKMKSPPRWTRQQIQYAAVDVWVLNDIRMAEVMEARDEDLTPTLKLENADVPTTADIKYTGIYVDREHWLNIVELAREGVPALPKGSCRLTGSSARGPPLGAEDLSLP